MSSYVEELLKECNCLLEHLECILWGFVIIVIIVLLCLKSKYFDNIV